MIKLELTLDEFKLIDHALGELPARTSHFLLNKLAQQVTPQLRETQGTEPPAPAEDSKPAPDNSRPRKRKKSSKGKN